MRMGQMRWLGGEGQNDIYWFCYSETICANHVPNMTSIWIDDKEHRSSRGEKKGAEKKEKGDRLHLHPARYRWDSVDKVKVAVHGYHGRDEGRRSSAIRDGCHRLKQQGWEKAPHMTLSRSKGNGLGENINNNDTHNHRS